MRFAVSLSAPSEAELAGARRVAGFHCVNDLGSGTLVDLTRWGLPQEPTVAGSARRRAPISSPSAATSCSEARKPA
ncbi:MAG: hypothetical protein U5O39_11705 [Gammaproteobacteria bacterium]|nr:hypothetical protein [Gammaproteobacteria bacterium]